MAEKRSAIDIVLEKGDALPLPEAAVFETLSRLKDPNTNFDRLAEFLSPTVALRLLATAAAMGGGAEIRSIHFAVKALGCEKIRQALISSILVDRLTRQPDYAHFDFDRFSGQAHLCAAVAGALGRMVGYRAKEELFTAAILHNIGKSIIAVHFPLQLQQIAALKQGGGISALEAERRVLETDHAQIGAAVLERFNLPEDICSAVRGHNAQGSPADAAADGELALMLHSASRSTGRFRLPAGQAAADIGDLLAEAVENGRLLYKKKFPEGRLTRAYRLKLADFLRIGSGLVELDLKKTLPARGQDETPP